MTLPKKLQMKAGQRAITGLLFYKSTCWPAV